jgi:hypothetical protein
MLVNLNFFFFLKIIINNISIHLIIDDHLYYNFEIYNDWILIHFHIFIKILLFY